VQLKARFHGAFLVRLALFTRGAIGITLRAAAVFPRVTQQRAVAPIEPGHILPPRRKHSSGRMPVSANMDATGARGSGAAAR
jgi:hypothetical protein